MCGLFRGYLFVWKYAENLSKPRGFTSKFNEGVGCQHGENLDLKVLVWLHTLPSCGFPRIKTTTIKVSQIELLHTNNSGSNEF